MLFILATVGYFTWKPNERFRTLENQKEREDRSNNDWNSNVDEFVLINNHRKRYNTCIFNQIVVDLTLIKIIISCLL